MNGVLGGVVVTVAGLLAAAVVSLRGRPRPLRYRLAEALMIAGTAPWLWLILRPGNQHDTLYLIPGTDLHDQFGVGLAFATWQIGGNLLVFAPFGFAAPIRWRVRPPAVTLLAALASAALETTQYLLADGRVASVDDVLVNAVGAGLAALCSYYWWRSRHAESEGAAGPGGGPSGQGSTLSSRAGTVGQR